MRLKRTSYYSKRVLKLSKYHPVIESIRYLNTRGVDVKPYVYRVRALVNAEIKTEAMFLRQLWNYTLTLYRDGDETAFLDDMIASIRNQLTRAWNEGADAVGVTVDEYTEQDNAALETIIQNEYDQVISLADAVLNARANLMATPDFRAQFKPRVEMWANRYGDVVNRAKTHFGGRMKLEWVLGETEEHCETCNRLNGIVAWASEWETAGIHPQSPPNPILECGGWRCGCRLEKTDKRKTSDALGKLLDIATAANL